MRAVLMAVTLAGALCAQDPFAFREVEGRSLELTEGGKPVFVYNYGLMRGEGAPADRARCCYLHPVYAPDGTVITDDFPRDHYHHRGISWMWPIVRIEGVQYDLWTLRGIRNQFVRWTAREADASRARLGVENGWYAGERRVLKETVEVVAWPSEAGRRNLDLTLGFEALERPLELRGEPAQKKGYGGLSFRFGPRQSTVVRTDAGQEKGDTNMVPHPWAELEGLFASGRAGARVTIDPSHPGYPNGWCLRYYGFLGVNYPGLAPLTLQPGRPLTLKYRVTVWAGDRSK
jgi:hypothetical protein